jgi:hypothetical protein
MINQITKFICDFVGYFAFVLFSLATFLVELVSQVSYFLNGLKSFLTTLLIEGFADLFIIMAVIYIGILVTMSNTSLYLSKLFLALAKITHDRSEKLVEKCWLNS